MLFSIFIVSISDSVDCHDENEKQLGGRMDLVPKREPLNSEVYIQRLHPLFPHPFHDIRLLFGIWIQNNERLNRFGRDMLC